MLNYQKFNKRGVALFLVMTLLTILGLMMMGFFRAYRSQFSLTRSGNASQRAGAACDAVYQYVVFRLEHDRTWGSVEFNGGGQGDPLGPRLDVTEKPGTHRFTGWIDTMESTFNAEIYNNLSGAASEEVAAQAEPGTVACHVTAVSGNSTRRADFVVRIAPLFDSSVLSRARLDVNADTLYMRSRDTNRNLLRAEGDIYVPNILTAKDSQFLQPDTDDADNKGMLWSKKDIYSYYGVNGPSERIDDDNLPDAVTNSNGRIVAGAESDFSIYPLDEDNLQLPEGNAVVPLKDDEGDMPGRWNFVRRLADVKYTANYSDGSGNSSSEPYDKSVWVDVLEHYPPGEDKPDKVYRARNREEDLLPQTPPSVDIKVGGKKKKKKTVTLGLSGVVTNEVEVPGYETPVTLLPNDVLEFTDEDNTANFTFDLMNQTVRASSNATVTVAGPFEVTSETDEKADADDMVEATPPPTLDLGYEEDSSVEGGVAKAALLADGTLNIENGITKGLGALISKTGDVKVQPVNTDTVTVDTGNTGSGLLVFAGGNVVLRNPDETANWVFKGLVYAREGIRMEGHGQNATFEGTIVSVQENEPGPPVLDAEGNIIFEPPNGIEFDDCGKIEFIYNSELLDAYVRNLPGQRIQVELVYWKR